MKPFLTLPGVLAACAAAAIILMQFQAGGWPSEPPPGSPAMAKAAGKEPPEPADNSYCYVCHVNYEEEKLAKIHQPVGVGCETCHGMSVQHSGDEDGLTPPERMFPRAEIMAYCLTCHPKADLLKDENHEDIFGPPTDTSDTCTTCHGKEHRLKVRTRVWDKKSGKLVKDDGVRMMSKDSPATSGAGRSAAP